VTLVLLALACLALPWLWGGIVAVIYRRRDRRRAGAAGEPQPPDYTISNQCRSVSV
jgi:hypothetical protein